VAISTWNPAGKSKEASILTILQSIKSRCSANDQTVYRYFTSILIHPDFTRSGRTELPTTRLCLDEQNGTILKAKKPANQQFAGFCHSLALIPAERWIFISNYLFPAISNDKIIAVNSSNKANRFLQVQP
jgi:hypothetical protein